LAIADYSFYDYRGASCHQRSSVASACIFVPHTMIAFFRRFNALCIAAALCVVYLVGIGLARFIHLFSERKNNSPVSHWKLSHDTQDFEKLSSPY